MELSAKYGLVKSSAEVIEDMMYKDAEPALQKLKTGKARLHRIEEV